MKTKNIYVGVNGATLAGLTSVPAVAVFPAKKGRDKSTFLLESGRFVSVKFARIGSVGVARYVKEQGFELAPDGDTLAEKLADHLDVNDGTTLVEQRTIKKAGEIQQEFAGQTCVFVPFDSSEPIRAVEIEAPRGTATYLADMLNRFGSGMVSTTYVSGFTDRLALSNGWIVGPEGDASAMPRLTEYGGLIEHAVYVICNAGMGTLVGPKNLIMDENAPVDDPFPRGKLEVALENGDSIQVGSDGADELHVQYHRNGTVIYSRTGMSSPCLGSVIGDIAAVLVRVSEMDAQPKKKASMKLN